jgi:NAD(P)H-flavin reductase
LREGVRRIISAPAFQIATTISHEILAAKFHYLVFEAEKSLKAMPGQYISVKVSNQRINCYSIATDEGENKFGLLIDTKPGGVGSKFFENIKTGDKITYLGPFGTFTFKPDDGSKQILFLGTGSGIAPLRCMIDDLIKNNTLNKPLNFYFGLRFTTDVFWHDYLQKLSEKYPNIKYKLVLSQPDESWHGLTGHITEAVKADFPDAGDCAAYLCGGKHMIEEATEILLASGCRQERIYSEKF